MMITQRTIPRPKKNKVLSVRATERTKSDVRMIAQLTGLSDGEIIESVFAAIRANPSRLAVLGITERE